MHKMVPISRYVFKLKLIILLKRQLYSQDSQKKLVRYLPLVICMSAAKPNCSISLFLEAYELDIAYRLNTCNIVTFNLFALRKLFTES